MHSISPQIPLEIKKDLYLFMKETFPQSCALHVSWPSIMVARTTEMLLLLTNTCHASNFAIFIGPKPLNWSVISINFLYFALITFYMPPFPACTIVLQTLSH